MKKTIVLLVLGILILFPCLSFADTFKLCVKHNLIYPEDGGEITSEEIDANACFKAGQVNLGVELAWTMVQPDFTKTKLTGVIGKDKLPVSLVGGYLTNNENRYAHGGVYIGKTVACIYLYLDSQIYWDIDGFSQDYWDNFFVARYKLKKFSLGPDLAYTLWYEEEKNHQSIFYGLVVMYDINDKVSIGSRFADSWEEIGKESSDTFLIRTFVNIQF